MFGKSKRNDRPVYQAAQQPAQPPAPPKKRNVPAFVAAVPVVLVNTVAFFGQFAFLKVHVHWPVPGLVLFAVALESIAVYLAWHAHVAMVNNDSATRLKMGASLFAALMGTMNYSHYAAPHWQPTFMAVGMFCMSSLSPWLWGIHSRRASRNTLMERGLIEEHAVRLGANRWTWHPLRSMNVMYHSTWVGETDPKRAIGAFQERAEQRAALRAERRNDRNKGRAVPAGALQAPAHTAVPVSAPVNVPALVPAQGAEHLIPGTTLNGHKVEGSAALEAGATLNYQPPTKEKIAEVLDKLIAMAPDERPAERDVARMLGHQDNQRRRARSLLKEAAVADARAALAPVPHRYANGHTPTAIAAPAATLPGGVSA